MPGANVIGQREKPRLTPTHHIFEAILAALIWTPNFRLKAEQDKDNGARPCCSYGSTGLYLEREACWKGLVHELDLDIVDQSSERPSSC
jgi:hypothetical protein